VIISTTVWVPMYPAPPATNTGLPSQSAISAPF
jgi:hypothetical protein